MITVMNTATKQTKVANFCVIHNEQKTIQNPKYKDIYEYALQIGVKNAGVLIQIIKLESGLKSQLWHEKNNPFGMYHPIRRQTTSIGKKGEYARYETWQKAIEDFKLYEENVLNDNENIYKQLKTYNKSIKYITVLKQIDTLILLKSE